MFGPAAILVHLARGSNTLRDVAAALLSLDEVGESDLNALHDAVEEDGGFHPMQSVQKDKNYLILTVTHYFIGRVIEKSFTDLVMDRASWVPETGQFSQVMASGELAEAEHAPLNMKIHLNVPVIVAAIEWPHALPSAKGGKALASIKSDPKSKDKEENDEE